MKNKQQYNKHKKRSHRSHRQSLIGWQMSKTKKTMSRAERAFFSGRFSGGY